MMEKPALMLGRETPQPANAKQGCQPAAFLNFVQGGEAGSFQIPKGERLRTARDMCQKTMVLDCRRKLRHRSSSKKEGRSKVRWETIWAKHLEGEGQVNKPTQLAKPLS